MILGLLLMASPALAEVRRVAMVLGNNEGGPGSGPLFFAEDDAEKVRDALTGVGGYRPEDVSLLLGYNKSELYRAFGDVRNRIGSLQRNGDQVVFLFYYSGHADDLGLQLGGTVLLYEELETVLIKSGAEVRLAFVDACNSGTMTRRKGGTMAPSFVFDVSERLATEGTVIITSSTADEASQESDAIGGSYFTHYLVSGLSGAADADSDAKVTLAEAYEYVYRETVLETSRTAAGTQHPTFEWDLSGEGDVVLADLAPTTSVLVFPAAMTGTWTVYDVERRTFVAEVDAGGAERRVAVRPGHYLVQARQPSWLEVAEVRVNEGQKLDVSRLELQSVEYEGDTARKGVDERKREATRPDNSVKLGVGGYSLVRPELGAAYIPAIPISMVAYRVDWHGGQWLTFDLVGGAGPGQIRVSGIPEPLDVSMSYGALGVATGWATADTRSWRAGIGGRVSASYIGRTLEDGSAQGLTQLTPGLSWWTGWHGKRLEAELEWHRMVNPYPLDSTKLWGSREVLLTVGYRW